MKNIITFILLLFGVFGGIIGQDLKAQTLDLLGGNTLNGAVNGVVLGGATMGLQNSNDFSPVRIGLGAGTLYGLGVGIHDLSQINKGQQYYISGTFNDGTNSSILVLLDTFYGAAGGALVASSISLIIKAPLGKAVQYGAGAGAWAGFGFGLVDAFALAQGPNFSQAPTEMNSSAVSGIVTYSNSNKTIEIGMISPAVVEQKEISKRALHTSYKTTLNLLQLKVGL